MRRQKYNQRKPVKRETVLKFERKVNECPGKTLGARDMDGNIITKTIPTNRWNWNNIIITP